ncbi:hypothetical protein GCM10007921_38520 [Tritonibacter mobilis]|nr:hypothetical protein GCM10007921_38520 [Tritonibacter mobilis]
MSNLLSLFNSKSRIDHTVASGLIGWMLVTAFYATVPKTLMNWEESAVQEQIMQEHSSLDLRPK